VGLIDAIGAEQAAIDWLRAEHGIDPDVPVRNVSERLDSFDLADPLGLSRIEALVASLLAAPRPMAIWQPQPR
jgi:hypothetical protein